MPELDLPGFTLYYLDCAGEPPAQPFPVLLLHGLGATSDSWQLQLPVLVQAGYRVLAPDARGFGRSGFPNRGSITAAAGDFAALLAAISPGKAYVVGISMGGVHALQLALDYPDKVEKLVLVNTFARLQPPSISGWFYFLRRFLLINLLGLERQASFVASRIFPREDQEFLRQELISQILQANPRAYRLTMRQLGLFNVLNRLGEIQMPTLVVTGEQDSTVPPASQRPLVELIPNARQVVIPAAGHAVSVDQHEQFNTVLLDFLNTPMEKLQ